MSRLEEKKFSWKDFLLCIMFCVIGVLVCFVIWALAKRTHEQFMLQFSFAATVSSIILSVLAIFLSITGEAKTDAIRDKIQRETEDIKNANTELKILLHQLEQKIDNVKTDTDEIKKGYINPSLQEVRAFQTPKVPSDNEGAK